MKTILKLLSILTLAVVLILSCKKNQPSEANKEQSGPSEMQKIESLVKYCTNRVIHSLKTNDSIPIDSVSFYLESTSNYTYGISSAHGDSQKIDTNCFTVPCKNKKAALTDVDSIYTTMIDSIRASYYTIQNLNKNLLYVQVNIINQQSNKINVQAVSNIIYGNNIQIGLFDTTDYWTWMGAYNCSGGKCGPYAGQGDPCKDAAKMIQNRVMLRKGLPIGCYIPPFIDVYLTNNLFPNPNWNGNWTYYNYFYSLFFKNSSSYPLFHSCLMPYEMNRYLQYAEYCVYTSNTQPSGAKPDGFTFISIELNGDLIVGSGGTAEVTWGWSHYGIYLAGGYQTPL